ncbi:MAG: ABC transporter substrate-binding protein, partial [Xanthomonadales bacterium]|nr:ABC transporter substrate-binding protein [Xanthomonadales bacterium]
MHTHRSPPEPHAQPRLAPALPLVRGALALLLTLVLAAIFSPPSLAGDVLRRGRGPAPDSADVHQAQGLAAVNLLRDLREGLVTFDVAGALVPGAASRWQALDEGRNWRFEIREDARWSNGDPVLSSDFVRGLSLALDPSNAAPMASLLAPIENASRRLSGDESPGALGVEALEPRVLE